MGFIALKLPKLDNIRVLKIYYLISTFQGKKNSPIQRVSRTIKLSRLMTKTTSRFLQLLSLCSASTLVIFLFFGPDYEFLSKKVIKMVRFSGKMIFICCNAYVISVIVFKFYFISANSSSNSQCFMLSCNNGYNNMNIMDLTKSTTSVQFFYLSALLGQTFCFSRKG